MIEKINTVQNHPIKTDYDIIIVGGGMIGTSLALALEPLNLKLALIEAVEAGDSQQPSFDDRSTVLSRSSQQMYMAMGLWDEILKAATPITSLHISDKGRFGFSHIEAKEQNVEALGYVVINRILGKVLRSTIKEKRNIEIMCPASARALKIFDDHNTVSIDDRGILRDLSCKLVVSADGSQSTTREFLGISTSKIDYKQSAIIGNLQTEKNSNNRAFERFTRSGPITLLPIQEDRMAFVWISSTEASKEHLDLSDEEFTSKLQEVFGFRLGKFSRIGARFSYPLALNRANRLIAKRGVLVGNAAHSLHPVAAQGFNLGLRDVATLSDCLMEAKIKQKFDPGDIDVLEKYSNWRKSDHTKLIHFTDGIVRLFGSGYLLTKIFRSFGMIGFDFIPGVRKEFARHTMGLAGKLPRLSRGLPLE